MALLESIKGRIKTEKVSWRCDHCRQDRASEIRVLLKRRNKEFLCPSCAHKKHAKEHPGKSTKNKRVILKPEDRVILDDKGKRRFVYSHGGMNPVVVEGWLTFDEIDRYRNPHCDKYNKCTGWVARLRYKTDNFTHICVECDG